MSPLQGSDVTKTIIFSLGDAQGLVMAALQAAYKEVYKW